MSVRVSVCLSECLSECLSAKKNFLLVAIKLANSVNRHLEFSNSSPKGLKAILHKAQTFYWAPPEIKKNNPTFKANLRALQFPNFLPKILLREINRLIVYLRKLGFTIFLLKSLCYFIEERDPSERYHMYAYLHILFKRMKRKTLIAQNANLRYNFLNFTGNQWRFKVYWGKILCILLAISTLWFIPFTETKNIGKN